LQQTCRDLLGEFTELRDLCASMEAAQWSLRTDFHGWTPWDEIAHLAFFDEAALMSARSGSAFAEHASGLKKRLDAGEEISAIARSRYRHLDGPGLLAHWSAVFHSLLQALSALDAKDRLAWYGPAMSARSFASARIMETWAHGQDVWDVLGRRRKPTGRLKHVAHLGVSTFKWTYANRGLAVPPAAPFVHLQAPEGETWRWGDAAASDVVRGTAEDFCLVVTQRRHVADTSLDCTPGTALEWMKIAQCFAGGPASGPEPGVRRTAG
jgi:uncharacterized protein (TIGR03084 family)